IPTQRTRAPRQPAAVSETLPWDEPSAPVQAEAAVQMEQTSELEPSEIPICRLDELPPEPSNVLDFPFSKTVAKRDNHSKLPTIYRLPSTELLNEIPVRSAFDEQELKVTAATIKSKLEEF